MTEDEFVDELDHFKNEVYALTLSFYTWLSIRDLAAADPDVFFKLQRHPEFWKVTLHSLQIKFLLQLGRIFDSTSPDAHHFLKIIKGCIRSIHIFSKDAFRWRHANSNMTKSDLERYISTRHEPSEADFGNLRKEFLIHQRLYDDTYRPIRTKVVAHPIAMDSNEIDTLFKNTDISKLKETVYTLNDLYDVLWNLFHNGRKP